MVSGLRQALERNENGNNTHKDDQVIVKTTLSLRRLVRFRGGLNQKKLSNRTAISTVCSFEEPNEGREEDTVARTLTTLSGTEALYCPQQEVRYLFQQGLEHKAQGRHEEAGESLTQALSLSGGSDLEPQILWTLVSHYAQREGDRSEAASYLVVLKPHVHKIQDEWIEQEASLALLDLLQQHGHWSLALKMTRYAKPANSVLARIHFETAANLTTEKAMPHLEKALSLCGDNDESLKQSILHTLVHAHAAEQEWDEAISVQESYMECLETPIDMAQAHHDAAELYLAQGHYAAALSSLEEGLKIVDTQETLGTNMLQAKALALYQLGDIEQALTIYKSLLVRVKHCPSDAAKIYYTMGRICSKTGRYDQALYYYGRELKVTRAALGKYHLETSRIYHDLARIHDNALGNYEQALKYYNKALKVEQRALKRSTRSTFVSREVSLQILETQRCMGRIHYKRGEFSKALDVSFADDVSV